MTNRSDPDAATAMQYLVWALEYIEKTGDLKAVQHARLALEALRERAHPPSNSFDWPFHHQRPAAALLSGSISSCVENGFVRNAMHPEPSADSENGWSRCPAKADAPS